MTAGDSSSLDYNRSEDPLIPILRDVGYEDWVEACQVLQGGYETATERGPVVVQHDKDCFSKTVNIRPSSTDTSAASTASTAPNAEIPSGSQAGTSSASSGTVTWSRLDTGLLVCHLCSYSTRHLGSQQRHSRTHTGERPFSCDLCPQSFKRREHLERHKRTHTGEQPYVCTICRAAFTTNRSLNQHMRIHTEERL